MSVLTSTEEQVAPPVYEEQEEDMIGDTEYILVKGIRLKSTDDDEGEYKVKCKWRRIYKICACNALDEMSRKEHLEEFYKILRNRDDDEISICKNSANHIIKEFSRKDINSLVIGKYDFRSGNVCAYNDIFIITEIAPLKD